MRVSVVSVSALALVVLVCAVASPVQGQLTWGPLGHFMTAAIAQNYLTPAATNAVKNLLPEADGQMAQVASWADTVARDLYKWSPPLHYIDTPDWACDYKRSRDCFDKGYPGLYCVDGAIQNFTSQLVKNDAPLSMNVALKFIIHFIGDIHQPLHVGFTSDAGGNTIVGTVEGTKNRKLHQVWDTDMVMKRIKDDFKGDNSTYLAYFMNRLRTGDWSSQISSWKSCPTDEPSTIHACSQSWASQSVVLACSTAYTDQNGDKIQNGFNLADPYYNFALPVAELQLARGGIRLANVVNAMFTKSNPATAIYTLEPREFKEAMEKKMNPRTKLIEKE